VGNGARVRRGMRTLALLVAAAILSAAPAPPPAQVPAAAQPPARPAITRIAHVAIQASDLAKARRFYGTVLGLAETHWDAGRGLAIFMVNARQRIIVRGGLPPERDERFIEVAFETESLDPMRTWLAAHGVETAAPADEKEAGGRTLAMTDRDSHRILLLAPAANRRDLETLPSGAGRALSKRILHVGLTVKDAAAADGFYKETLGFSETWRGGRPEGTINWINMRVPDGTDYVEYMLYPAAPPTRNQLGSAHHVALMVPDIQQALETVRARTGPDDRNHRVNPSIGVNNRWQLNLFDPDGTRVELMEPWTVR